MNNYRLTTYRLKFTSNLNNEETEINYISKSELIPLTTFQKISSSRAS